MSAFLGPIHHWLYGKIQLQEAFIATLADAAEKNHWNTGDKTRRKLCETTKPVLWTN
jgi:hypothetical protein